MDLRLISRSYPSYLSYPSYISYPSCRFHDGFLDYALPHLSKKSRKECSLYHLLDYQDLPKHPYGFTFYRSCSCRLVRIRSSIVDRLACMKEWLEKFCPSKRNHLPYIQNSNVVSLALLSLKWVWELFQ